MPFISFLNQFDWGFKKFIKLIIIKRFIHHPDYFDKKIIIIGVFYLGIIHKFNHLMIYFNDLVKYLTFIKPTIILK